ncbi:MAG: 1,4-dihydroxy-2-naphthoate octaprenyltransferase [Parachlamydia sp.]|nr:1,4-dihydroxy-2-naphthoate octaprenyltransferase [Parachlamydia sp.]
MTFEAIRKPAAWKIWLMTIRPKALTQPFVPVYAATLLAFSSLQTINWILAGFSLLVAILVQHGSHLINDAIDFKRGADTPTRLGPIRPLQKGLLTFQEVYMGGLVCLLLALVAGIPLIQAGGLPVAGALVASVAMAYLYTGGPYPLAYSGLSDLFVFLFYGWCCTTSVYYVQTLRLDPSVFLLSTQLGLLATVMLVVVNLRDVKDDTKINKRTLVVRIGPTWAKVELTCLALLPFALSPIWWWLGYTEAALLPLISLPLALKLVIDIYRHEPGTLYNRFMELSGLLHLSFALLLSIGFVIK